MALVINPDGTKSRLSNQRFLISNRKRVRKITLQPAGSDLTTGRPITTFVAMLVDGSLFTMDFADRQICRDFAHGRSPVGYPTTRTRVRFPNAVIEDRTV